MTFTVVSASDLQFGDAANVESLAFPTETLPNKRGFDQRLNQKLRIL